LQRKEKEGSDEGEEELTPMIMKKTVRRSSEQSYARDHQQVVFSDYMHESVSNGVCETVEED